MGAAALLAGGCGKKGGTTPQSKGLEMTEAGLAGITETTTVDAATLNRLVPDAEVRPDPDSSDIQELYRGGERIFYVVAKSSNEPSQGVFNVQVTHASIPGPNGWRVGDNLASTANLDMCECWQDLRVCFKKGTHVAVAIDRDECEGLPEVGTGIIGKPIARLIWNPRPWPEIADYEDMPHDGDGDEDPCGGDWEGEGNPCG
jgi:hypothetical protein